MPKKKKAEKSSNDLNIVWGFFFYVNLCIGNGFLNFPFTFTYSGYLAAVPTLLAITVVSWVSSNYILEVIARAQLLQGLEDFKNATDGLDSSGTETERENNSSNLTIGIPTYGTIRDRKYEISDLCEIFFNKTAKYFYLTLQSLYIFSCCWSYTTVAGSAWATNIPFYYIHESLRCTGASFLHRVLPPVGCLYSYYISIAIFATIVTTLSLLNLKEQAMFQLLLGLLRFFTIGVTSIYSIYRLVEGGDSCMDYIDDDEYSNSSTNIPIANVAFKFDPKGWLQAIPIFLFANMFQLGIPSLSHPIKQKQLLHWLFVVLMIITCFSYLCIGLIVPLWFRATIEEVCTLNWAVFTSSDHNLPLRVLSYYLVLFPSIDVLSTFTLCVHIQVNSIYSIITGHDTSEEPKYKHDWLLRLVLRFTAAVLPIGAAFGVSNLTYVLKVGGFLGLVCYEAAFLLQVRSIYTCREALGAVLGAARSNGLKSAGKEENVKKLKSKKKRKYDPSLYMTPYSFRLISGLPMAWIMSIIGVVLYVLTFVDFFFEPDKLNCIEKITYQNESLAFL